MESEPLCRWYLPNDDDEEDEKNRAAQLLAETGAIEQRQSSWHELNLWNAALFSNREVVGFRWGEMEAGGELWPVNLKTENIIEEVGEATMSKAASSPLKPSLIPHGHSWKTERAVRLLDNFLFGVWRQTQSEEAAIEMFLDAYLCGLGCVRIDFDSTSKKLHVQSVFFDNVIIDNRECANRAPPRTYRIRTVLPKASVEARYGKPVGDQRRYVDYREVGEHWVVVVEAWRLPDSDGTGGRHTVACGDALLVDEDWKHDWVPLVFFHWTDLTSGFLGKSGVEQLVPFQNRQDGLNEAIELSQDIVCRPRLLINANSMVDVNQWDNEFGRFLMWSGVEPKPFEWRTNLSDLYQERERNRASAFSHVGMSEQFAGADLANGVRLDSSAGLREFHNMEDRRNLRRWQRFETARMNISKTTMLVLANSPNADAFTAVYHPGGSKSRAKSIVWEAVKTLADNEYAWQMEPVPLASMSPAARRELLRDWSSRGLVQEGSEEARRMEGNPNLERVEDLEMSSEDDILRHIGILEEGDYEAPTEMTNIPKGMAMVTANYHRLKNYEDVRQKVFDNHVKWVVTAAAIQQAAIAPPTPVPFAPTQGMPGTNATTLQASAAAQPAA
jgi:hypothetical protein